MVVIVCLKVRWGGNTTIDKIEIKTFQFFRICIDLRHIIKKNIIIFRIRPQSQQNFTITTMFYTRSMVIQMIRQDTINSTINNTNSNVPQKSDNIIIEML